MRSRMTPSSSWKASSRAIAISTPTPTPCRSAPRESWRPTRSIPAGWGARPQPELVPHGPAGARGFGGYGKVFLQDGIHGVRVADLRTGRPLWAKEVAGPTRAQRNVRWSATR